MSNRCAVFPKIFHCYVILFICVFVSLCNSPCLNFFSFCCVAGWKSRSEMEMATWETSNHRHRTGLFLLSFYLATKKNTKEYNSTIGRRLHSPTVYGSACVFVGITSLWRYFSRKFCFHPHQCGESPETKKFPLIIVFCFQKGCIRVDDIQNYLWTLKRYYTWLPSWFKDD